MAKKRSFVLVYCAASHPSPAEFSIEDQVENGVDVRFRNGRHFTERDIEYRMGLVVASAVYTNNPEIKAAYEALNGTRVKVGAQHVTLNVPVHPIAPPVSTLPTSRQGKIWKR